MASINIIVIFVMVIGNNDTLMIKRGIVESYDWTVGASIPKTDITLTTNLFLLLKGFTFNISRFLADFDPLTNSISTEYNYNYLAYYYAVIHHPTQ